jgi:hypothetical protein
MSAGAQVRMISHSRDTKSASESNSNAIVSRAAQPHKAHQTETTNNNNRNDNDDKKNAPRRM